MANIQISKELILYMKTRLDLQCICDTCKTNFTVHGIDKQISYKGGIHIGEFKCCNCGSTGLDFDLLRVKDFDDI
jgi:C4-type Zn-finger protein